MYDMLDHACADALGVSVEEYIRKIESTTPKRAEVIIGAIFSEDERLIEKARRIFSNLSS